MPHIVVEMDRATAAGLDGGQLVSDLHNALADQETVNKSAIKTRLHVAEISMAGEDEVPGFVAVVVKLMPGRSEALKGQMADALLGIVMKVVPAGTAASVEITELGVYRK